MPFPLARNVLQHWGFAIQCGVSLLIVSAENMHSTEMIIGVYNEELSF